jgi:tellurite resistance protein
MTGTTQSQDVSPQTSVWLRGLIAVAWADGQFDRSEQTLIASLTQQELNDTTPDTLISPIELAAELGHDRHQAENFLRMAVMVALADRSYSSSEDELLQQYCQALDLKPEALETLRRTLNEISLAAEQAETASSAGTAIASPLSPPDAAEANLLHPVKDWLDQMEIHDPKVAHMLCKLIPPQCPFERDISLFGRKVAHIPALCKLNPLYDQFVGLRFRALSYLADDCGEDVSEYC